MLERRRTASCLSCHGLSSIFDSRPGLLPELPPSAHVQVKADGFGRYERNLPQRGYPLRKAQEACRRKIDRVRPFLLALSFSGGFSFPLLLKARTGHPALAGMRHCVAPLALRVFLRELLRDGHP